MSDVRGGLPWLVAHHERLWIDEAECIDNNLALDGLYGVNNYCDGAWCKLFEGLLCIDVDRG